MKCYVSSPGLLGCDAV